MVQTLKRLFIDHPSSVEETYFQHLRFASWFSVQLLTAGGAALVHAFIPALFEKTASKITRELYTRTANRG